MVASLIFTNKMNITHGIYIINFNTRFLQDIVTDLYPIVNLENVLKEFL